MLFYHVISFSFRLYLHAFIIIPPLIIRKSREVTIENKPPRGFTPPSWASEKGRWMKNCQGNYDDLTQNGVNLESPWLLLTRPKSLSPVCKNPNLFERGTNSFPFLSFPFFSFFFPLSKERFSRIHYPLQKRTRTSYLSPWYKTRGMRKRRYIHIYTKEWDLVFGKEEGYLTDKIQRGGGDCQEIGPF